MRLSDRDLREEISARSGGIGIGTAKNWPFSNNLLYPKTEIGQERRGAGESYPNQSVWKHKKNDASRKGEIRARIPVLGTRTKCGCSRRSGSVVIRIFQQLFGGCHEHRQLTVRQKWPTPLNWMSARRCRSEVLLRLDLPDDTFLAGAAVRRRTVQVAARVEYYVANRVETIVAAREIVQRGVSPSVT
jgi:hypothetical protein